MEKNKILSLGYIVALVFLIANDHFLKELFPGIITGKLSDFAGLFLFPIFISCITPRFKRDIYVGTFLLFIIWKSPFSEPFIDTWNAVFDYQVGRVIDFTDLFALVILPVSYYYNPEKFIFLGKRTLKFSIILSSIFAIIATGGVHGKIHGFKFNTSKNRMNKAIKIFFLENPEYLVPSEMSNYTWHFGSYPSDDEWTNQINADSVSFHFYIDSPIPKIIWTQFISVEENWNGKNCTLAIIGVIEPGSKWMFDDNTSDKVKSRIVTHFEENISSKIKIILKEKIP